MSAQPTTIPDKSSVLSIAVLKAANEIGLSQTELGAVLGVHRSAVSRLKRKPNIDPESKQGELALLLIRIARALFALTGGDREWMAHFMRTKNAATQGVPVEQVTSIQGLITVLNFVDAIRGKI